MSSIFVGDIAPLAIKTVIPRLWRENNYAEIYSDINQTSPYAMKDAVIKNMLHL